MIHRAFSEYLQPFFFRVLPTPQSSILVSLTRTSGRQSRGRFPPGPGTATQSVRARAAMVSDVWRFCTKLSETHVRCNQCGRVMSYHGTTNLRVHIGRHFGLKPQRNRFGRIFKGYIKRTAAVSCYFEYPLSGSICDVRHAPPRRAAVLPERGSVDTVNQCVQCCQQWHN